MVESLARYNLNVRFPRNYHRTPMCHMEYRPEEHMWVEHQPRPSQMFGIQICVDKIAYQDLTAKTPAEHRRAIDAAAVADTGAQMDVIDIYTMKRLGVKMAELLPVSACIGGAARGSKLNVIGAFLLSVREQRET